MTSPSQCLIVGGGIIGLAVADRLIQERPGSHITVVEKEFAWAQHQTGRNSGVIHSGVYYVPGSKKALMCRAGSASMVRFAQDEGIPYDICGKLIVATREDELPRLARLRERGLANGLGVSELTPSRRANMNRTSMPSRRCLCPAPASSTTDRSARHWCVGSNGAGRP